MPHAFIIITPSQSHTAATTFTPATAAFLPAWPTARARAPPLPSAIAAPPQPRMRLRAARAALAAPLAFLSAPAPHARAHASCHMSSSASASASASAAGAGQTPHPATAAAAAAAAAAASASAAGKSGIPRAHGQQQPMQQQMQARQMGKRDAESGMGYVGMMQGGDGAVGSVTAEGQMTLVTGAVAIPHPEKIAKGGEDAWFASEMGMGVFDGVGGWASVGVDPGLYSKQLAETTARFLKERGPAKALDALTAAVDHNSEVGSSTACVVGLVNETVDVDEFEEMNGPHVLDLRDVPGAFASVGVDGGTPPPPPPPPSRSSSMSSSDGSEVAEAAAAAAADSGIAHMSNVTMSTTSRRRPRPASYARLVGVNLGDSGLIVIRDGAIVYATKEQQHYFNCPFQVGSGVGADSVDTPAMGDTIDVRVFPGDCLILATDGCFDNLFPHEILATVAAHIPPEASEDVAPSVPPADPKVVAKALADFALQVAMDERRQSPFAVNAQDAGHIYRGGKIDDITCVVAFVLAPRQEEENAEEASRVPASRGASSTSSDMVKEPPTSPLTPTISPSHSSQSAESGR